MPAFEEAESKKIYGTSTAAQYGKFSTYLGHSSKVGLFDFKVEAAGDCKAVLNPLAMVKLPIEGEEVTIAGMSAEAATRKKSEEKEESLHQFRSLQIEGTEAKRAAPGYQLLIHPAVKAQVAAANRGMTACAVGEIAALSKTALEAEGIGTWETFGIGAAISVGLMAGHKAYDYLRGHWWSEPPTGKFSLECDKGMITAATKGHSVATEYSLESDTKLSLQSDSTSSQIELQGTKVEVRSASISLASSGGARVAVSESSGATLEGSSIQFTFGEAEIA
jgi:hypothetical protein